MVREALALSLCLCLGLAIGVMLFWPVGGQTLRHACSPGLMAASPICAGHVQTRIWGGSLGGAVGLVGGWVAAFVGGGLGALIGLTVGRVGRLGLPSRDGEALVGSGQNLAYGRDHSGDGDR